MPIYSYKGIDRQGNEVIGQVEAEERREVVQYLRNQAVSVLEIQEGDFVESIKFLGWIARFFRLFHFKNYLPVTSADLIVFFNQLAMMLRAGHTLAAALDAVQGMAEKLRFARSIGRIAENIRKGKKFSDCLSMEGRGFSSMMVNLIAVGETSGNLAEILERLADNLERKKDVKRQVFSAMFYPCFIFLAAIGVMAFMVLWVVPKFVTFLTARNAELPAMTQALIDFAAWAQEYAFVIGTVSGGTAFGTLAAYTFPKGKMFIDRVLLKIPVVGTALLFGAMAQTGWTLSLLMRSGVTAMESLRINGKAQQNASVGVAFERASKSLLNGLSMSKAFEQPQFPKMMRHMTEVGEKSGELDNVMDSMGNYYQKELTAKVKFISVMVEPLMIVFVGGVVAFVYISLVMAVLAVSKGGM